MLFTRSPHQAVPVLSRRAFLPLQASAYAQRRAPGTIASHAEAQSWDATDWRQIVLLYDLLLQMSPSPVVRLNRAVALRQVAGPEAALAEVNAVARDLDHYHLFHSIRGELLLELGHREQARASALRAL